MENDLSTLCIPFPYVPTWTNVKFNFGYQRRHPLDISTHGESGPKETSPLALTKRAYVSRLGRGLLGEGWPTGRELLAVKLEGQSCFTHRQLHWFFSYLRR